MPIRTATTTPIPTVKRKTKIMWGVPCDELMYSRWAMWLMHMPRHPEDLFTHIIGTYVPFARNSIHQEFLRSGYDWLFMLDSDVCPNFEIVDILLGHGLKVVSGWYNTKEVPKRPCVYRETGLKDAHGIPTWEQFDKPGTGLQKVDGIGMGTMLMHREVAEKLGQKPYDENEGGEDLKLCRQIRALGYDVWCDWNLEAKHVGIAVF
jgi:hypothetical protein